MKTFEVVMRAWLVLLAFVVVFTALITGMRAAAIVILFQTPVTYGVVQTSEPVTYDNEPYHSITVSLPNKEIVSATYSTDLPEFKVGDRVPIRILRDIGRVDSITELYELPRLTKLVLVVVPMVWLTLWGLKRYQRQLDPLDPQWFRIVIFISIVLGLWLFLSALFYYMPL